MAFRKWKDCVVLVGAADPAATPMLKKRDVKYDGPSQITDDVTCDEDAGPAHAVVYPGQIKTMSFQIVKDTADASFIILDTAAKSGAHIFAIVRPEGTGAALEEGAFSCTVDMVPAGNTAGMSKMDVTLKVSGGVEWSEQAP